MLTKRVKTRIIKDSQQHDKDTGSTQVQISVITRQMKELTSHLKDHPKDNHSRRGLLKLVSRRRRLLSNLEDKEPEKYTKLVQKLGLKK